jgi:hypothetical protein
MHDLSLYCNHCGKKDSMAQGFEKVTKLQQFSFLLRVALKRLYQLLDVKGKKKKKLRGGEFMPVIKRSHGPFHV